MDIKVRLIEKEKPELVEISCHEVTDGIRDIISFVKLQQGQITGSLDGEQFEIPVIDIFYIESVDDISFIYCKEKVYETRQRLYEIEDIICGRQFLRISKSCIINLMKVKSIKPALNGRYFAILSTGEEIIISRKYVPALKSKLRGEK